MDTVHVYLCILFPSVTRLLSVVVLRLRVPLVDMDAARAGALKSFPSLALNPAPPFPFISSLSALHCLCVFLSLCLDKRRSDPFARSSQPQIETSFMPAKASELVW